MENGQKLYYSYSEYLKKNTAKRFINFRSIFRFPVPTGNTREAAVLSALPAAQDLKLWTAVS